MQFCIPQEGAEIRKPAFCWVFECLAALGTMDQPCRCSPEAEGLGAGADGSGDMRHDTTDPGYQGLEHPDDVQDL